VTLCGDILQVSRLGPLNLPMLTDNLRLELPTHEYVEDNKSLKLWENMNSVRCSRLLLT